MWRRFFGPKYDDTKLRAQAERALAGEPLLRDTRFEVSSEDGILMLKGYASSEQEKDHALNAVRLGLEAAGLKYLRITHAFTAQ
jgi:osmotically-inducible protein OsmY